MDFYNNNISNNYLNSYTLICIFFSIETKGGFCTIINNNGFFVFDIARTPIGFLINSNIINNSRISSDQAFIYDGWITLFNLIIVFLLRIII